MEGAEGEDAAAMLEGVIFEIVDLPGNLLGRAIGNAIVQLDVDAAGYGWFVDTTPWDNEEFTVYAGHELVAAGVSPAEGRVDLLTVVLHELTHILGYGHTDEGLMDGTLLLGTRRLLLDDCDGLIQGDDLRAGAVDLAFASFAW
jgi:hypothetical protein